MNNLAEFVPTDYSSQDYLNVLQTIQEAKALGRAEIEFKKSPINYFGSFDDKQLGV